MDFLLRRSSRQLYIIDGCMWYGMIEIFLYLLSHIIYVNRARYIDAKKMLDRLDNFKCKICPFRYMYVRTSVCYVENIHNDVTMFILRVVCMCVRNVYTPLQAERVALFFRVVDV